jgi:hypothetical protein
MLLPAFAAGVWVERLQLGNYKGATALRGIQDEIGLMGPYLNQTRQHFSEMSTGAVKQPIDLNSLHGKIVLQHGYLTSGVSEFLTDLFPSTCDALKEFKTLMYPQPGQLNRNSTAFLMEQELNNYVEHMRIRANTELQHRNRMLDRMNVYFQVVS